MPAAALDELPVTGPAADVDAVEAAEMRPDESLRDEAVVEPDVSDVPERCREKLRGLRGPDTAVDGVVPALTDECASAVDVLVFALSTRRSFRPRRKLCTAPARPLLLFRRFCLQTIIPTLEY